MIYIITGALGLIAGLSLIKNLKKVSKFFWAKFYSPRLLHPMQASLPKMEGLFIIFLWFGGIVFIIGGLAMLAFGFASF